MEADPLALLPPRRGAKPEPSRAAAVEHPRPIGPLGSTGRYSRRGGWAITPKRSAASRKVGARRREVASGGPATYRPRPARSPEKQKKQ
jgi:hypothetical protein